MTSEWLFSTRVDYNLSANQRVFFRFETHHGEIPLQTSDISPLFNAIAERPDYEGQVNHTLVITPRLVNNFIGSLTNNSYALVVPDEAAAAVQALPFRLTNWDGGANGGGFAPLGPGVAFPFGHGFGQFEIVDDLSYSRGRHVFQAGVSYRYNPESDLLNADVGQGKFAIFRLNDFATGSIAEMMARISGKI